jgi:hypothetical protein
MFPLKPELQAARLPRVGLHILRDVAANRKRPPTCTRDKNCTPDESAKPTPYRFSDEFAGMPIMPPLSNHP